MENRFGKYRRIIVQKRIKRPSKKPCLDRGLKHFCTFYSVGLP